MSALKVLRDKYTFIFRSYNCNRFNDFLLYVLLYYKLTNSLYISVMKH